MQTAYPKEFELLQKANNWQTVLLDRVQEFARQHGALALLRDLIGIAGVGRFKMSESAPEDDRNEEVAQRYRSNILRVVRQVHHHTTSEESLDLVFYSNGVPVATVEVKTDFKQGLTGSKKEPLRQWKSAKISGSCNQKSAGLRARPSSVGRKT